MKEISLYGLALGISALLLTSLPAAEPRQGASPSRQGEASRRNGNQLDGYFATCLLLDNQNEIAVARLAEERSKSPTVKKFAEMLQKDHHQFIGELVKVGGLHFQDRRPGSPETDSKQTAGQDPINETTTRQQPRRAGDAATSDDHNHHLQIKREIADERAKSAERELSSKEGREFDACFIEMQLAAHQVMIDELKVLERHASNDLQETLKKGRETAQGHLDRAKEIMKDIERGETRTTSK